MSYYVIAAYLILNLNEHDILIWKCAIWRLYNRIRSVLSRNVRSPIDEFNDPDSELKNNERVSQK